MRTLLYVAFMTALVLLFLGCGRGAEVESGPPSTPGGLVFPPEVLSASAEVQEAYRFAAEHPEVLGYMPCYCRCEDVGHISTWDCFIDEITPQGFVRIDKMGFT